jgi:competence protein ComEC
MMGITKWWCVNPENKRKSCTNHSLKSKHLSLYFFYVKNESILIQTPKGKNILYDCGDESAAEEIHNELVHLGVNKLDAMIASHTHRDHVGGFYIFANLTNRQVKMGDLYDNGETSTDKWFTDKYKDFKNNLPNGGKYYSMKDFNGDGKLNLDNDIDINLYVDYDWSVESEQSKKYRSVWMKISYDHASILLAGDSKSAYEKRMVNRFPIGNPHILKLSEHGSKESTTENFLQRVRPIFAIACNKHHHDLPHPDVIKRLNREHVKLFSTTNNHNDIEVLTDGTVKNGMVGYRFTY